MILTSIVLLGAVVQALNLFLAQIHAQLPDMQAIQLKLCKALLGPTEVCEVAQFVKNVVFLVSMLLQFLADIAVYALQLVH